MMDTQSLNAATQSHLLVTVDVENHFTPVNKTTLSLADGFMSQVLLALIHTQSYRRRIKQGDMEQV